ncbi:MAG: hypothetical protein QNK43_00740 [Amphritea sp.]|nr:hypothetical protein [Amphritea sp.]
MQVSMISLSLLVRLQACFAALSLTYLLASAGRQYITGEPLSAAAIGPSIVLFIAYCGALCFPRIDKVNWYRISMLPALVLFGGGGVIGNIDRYLNSGLAEYASFAAWAVAVAINLFGTVLNVIAALGLFRRGADD